ncbi:Tryptophan synthase beta chain, partial [Clarias magur]
KERMADGKPFCFISTATCWCPGLRTEPSHHPSIPFPTATTCSRVIGPWLWSPVVMGGGLRPGV